MAMKIGYARVSTKDQTVALQVDALKKAGCSKVHTEVMSGARSDRPVRSKLLENLRAGDVLVIWKLDRLGRSLQHLVDLVNDLMARKVGLKSLNDDALDARLVRNGDNVKNLCDRLNAKPREINAFIRGQLPPEHTQQLSSQLLAVGVPL